MGISYITYLHYFYKLRNRLKIRMKLKRAMYELIVTENVNQTLWFLPFRVADRNKRPGKLIHLSNVTQIPWYKSWIQSVGFKSSIFPPDHITTKSRGTEESSSLKELCTKLVKLWKVYIPCNSLKSSIFL